MDKKKTEEIQRYADAGDQQYFHSALTQVYGPTDRSPAPVGLSNGTTLLIRINDILQRWQQYYSTLLCMNNPSNPGELRALAVFPEVESMVTPPKSTDMLQAINSLKTTEE